MHQDLSTYLRKKSLNSGRRGIMTKDNCSGRFGIAKKGKIGILIEDHYDPTELDRFNSFFPEKGYQVEYITHLWGTPSLHFWSNPDNGKIVNEITVTTEVNDVSPTDYKGIILIGGYAMDRLRYEKAPQKGVPNKAPSIQFLRKVFMTKGLKLGTICHSLWLLCADRKMVAGRRVTCAENIICDVENAGGEVVYAKEGGTVNLVIDGDLISAKHPGIVDQFMAEFLSEIEK